MDADRKAESRRQPFGQVVPASAAVGRAPYTMVVLLVKHVACTRRTYHVVNAVSDLTVAWRGRVVAVTTCFDVREAVAALPGRSAVLELERAVADFAATPAGGLIILPDVFTVGHRDLIVALAARYRLPAVYPQRAFAVSGGLISDSGDITDIFRQTACRSRKSYPHGFVR